MRRSNWLPLTILTLVLTAFGLFAYMSQQPESELWQHASRLPVVGETMAGWHWYYKVEKQRAEGLRPGSPEGRDGEVIEHERVDEVVVLSTASPGSGRRGKNGKQGGLEEGYSEGHEEGLGEGDWVTSPSHVWVVPGIQIYAAPNRDAKVVETMTAIANLAFTERQGDYFYVQHEKVRGWVFLPAYDDGDVQAPPLGSAAEPPGPLEPRAADAKLLAAARKILGEKENVSRLGAYELYTDVNDPALLALLTQLANQIEPLYQSRYGRPLAGQAKGAVVLYAAESAYRAFQQQSEALRGLSSTGHNSLGVVALYVGDRQAEDVGSTLLHELGHLLNRRALGPALPSWLDEGLCEDIAFTKIGPGGHLLPAEMAGRSVRTGQRIDFEGASTSFFRLRGLLLDHQLPTLRELAALDWRGFVHSEKRRTSYDLAGVWVRYLVDGEKGRRAPGWRAFLFSVASGGQPDTSSLMASLQEEAELVEANFRVWLLDSANHLFGPP